ncbi:MAG: CpsD/CapB family tyrosine-protein kinase [Candidatus Sulfotelmatobacter sp.]
MSRIHEALQKAEHERAAAQGGRPQPNHVDVPSEPSVITIQEKPSAEGITENPSNRGIPLASTMPSFAGPFNLDAMMARCLPQSWAPDVQTMLFFNGDDNVRGAEEFRTLRSRLYSVREKMGLKKLLVTSALPKEGKSFTAANLAQVLARQHGRRVLLIDADLRGPRLHMMLGTSSAPGLADYLQGGSDEFSIMQRGPMENLFFIPSGHEISDPADLVSNGRLKALLQRLEPLFDWIIIDSPPAVPVSDSSVLAKACDGVLLVVLSNGTPIDMARRARQEFPEEALVGVVLNGISPDALPYTRYYYEEVGKNTIDSKI